MNLGCKLIPVKSSNITAIGYKGETETLVILFHSGTTYTYQPIPDHMYQELMAAESIGKYFHQEIKSNIKIKCQRI